MELREPSDLTNISFDEFVSLIFERDTPPEAGKLDASFYDVGVEFDAERCALITSNCFRSQSFWFRASRNSNLKRGSGNNGPHRRMVHGQHNLRFKPTLIRPQSLY